MGIVNVTLGDGKKLNLILGQQLENAVTAVVFDFSAWKTEFGSGTLGLSVQRHGDDQPYAVVPTVSGNNATWNISDLDTAYKGVGEVQVTYTVGTKVKKSVVYKFTVQRSLGENGEYPSPGQTWQEEIEDELADVKQDLSNSFDDTYGGLSVVPYLPSGDTSKFTSAVTDSIWGIKYLFKQGYIESITINRSQATTGNDRIIHVFITDKNLVILKKVTVYNGDIQATVPINYNCEEDFYVFIRCIKMKYGYVDGVSRPSYTGSWGSDGYRQEGASMSASWGGSATYTFDYVVNRKPVATRIEENKTDIETFTTNSISQEILSGESISSLSGRMYGNSFEYPAGYVESITLGFIEASTSQVMIWLLDSNHKVLKKVIDYEKNSATPQTFQIDYLAEEPFNIVVYAPGIGWQNSQMLANRYNIWDGSWGTYGYTVEGETLFSDWGSSNSLIHFDITVNYSEVKYYNNVSYKKRDRIYTLQDAFKSWIFGEKFPIVVLGDSTTDGDATTGNTPNTVGTDHVDPNLYTTKLEEYLRTALNNSVLRIYNAGFSGRSAGWALQNLNEIIWDNSYYNDCKMVIISHGINDYVNSNNNYNQFKYFLRQLILECFAHNVQPVIMTTQAGTENQGRFAWKQMSLADKINKELADEYNLELIDKNALTAFFNVYSSKSISAIIPDGCHYADAGHEYVAGLMFANLVPFTVWAEEGETILGFANEQIQTALEYSSFTGYVWKDVKIITPTNGFKLEADCSKDTSTKLMEFWVFIHDKHQKSLVSYCNTPNVQHVTVDGTTTNISSATQTIGTLDLGLHHIVVTSDASSAVNYLGLKLVNA